MNSIKLARALLLALPLLTLSPAFAADMSVSVKGFHFMPPDLTVPVGTRVVWKNLDPEPHTIFSTDGLFRSPALEQNETFAFTFTRPGVYRYICSIHRQMVATVTVK